jgi:hypothetical protein
VLYCPVLAHGLFLQSGVEKAELAVRSGINFFPLGFFLSARGVSRFGCWHSKRTFFSFIAPGIFWKFSSLGIDFPY